MHTTLGREAGRRRSVRRAVRVETDVVADTWDGAVPLLATDLSDHGLWLESELPLEIGSEVVVSLLPPRWPTREPLTALAEVTRVGMYRRRRERRSSGMGLRFVDLPHDDAELLAEVLRGLPPPLPALAPRGRAVELVRPSIDEGRLPQIVLADGSRFVLRAEGSLLTAGRGPDEHVRSYAPVVPITSTMSAILGRLPPMAAETNTLLRAAS